MIGSGDLREKGSLVEGCVVCIKEWMREEISLKRGGRWEKRNILEGRGIREKAREYVWKGREENKGRRQKRPWKNGREEEVREYIVKKRNGINLKRVRERDKEMWGRRRRRRRVGRRMKRKVVWWRVASWQLCREKTDPPLLPPQTVFFGWLWGGFWLE